MSANNRAGHKFNVDQVVDYAPKGASKFSVPRGAYKMTKLLPERDGISAVTVQAAWRYWRNVPGFAAVNESMRLAHLAEITVRNNGSIS